MRTYARFVSPVALALIAVAAPFDVAIPANGFGPLFIRPLMIVGAILTLVALGFRRNETTRLVPSAVLALILSIWVATMAADNPTASAAAAIRLTLVAGIFLASWSSIRTVEDRRIFTLGLAAATLISSAIGLITHLAGQDLAGTGRLLGSISSSNGVLRLTRPFSQANIAAMYLVPATAVCAVSASRPKQRPSERVLFTLAAIAGTAAVALTYSTGGYVSLVTAFAVGAFVLRRGAEGSPTGLLALTASLALVRVLNPEWERRTRFLPGVEDRPRPLKRTGMWEQAIDAFFDRPVTGLGPGRFGPWSVGATPTGFVPAPHAHSVPLELLATTGVVGTIALASLVAASFHELSRSGAPDTALLAGSLAIGIHALVDYGLIFSSSGFVIALVLGAFLRSGARPVGQGN